MSRSHIPALKFITQRFLALGLILGALSLNLMISEPGLAKESHHKSAAHSPRSKAQTAQKKTTHKKASAPKATTPQTTKATTVALTKPTKTILPDMIKGSATSPVTLVEYGSATCSHCAHWFKTVYPDLEKKYIQTGKVKYIFREVITAPENLDYAVYLLARCASQKPTISKPSIPSSASSASSSTSSSLSGASDSASSASAVAVTAMSPESKAYFTIVDGFWTHQDEVYAARDAAPTLKLLTSSAGMSEADVNGCLKNEALFNALQNTMQTLTDADDVQGTPTFFINGKRFTGEPDFNGLEAAILAASH